MNIYLIRHGRQNSALCNVNVPLAIEGRKQADLLGKRMQSYNIDMLYSSDLIRAVETANVMNEHLKVEHRIRKEIRESDFGVLEGGEEAQLRVKYKEFYDAQKTLESDIPYPGGECGLDVYNRAIVTMEEIINSEYENVAVVTHGGVIRALVTKLLGMDLSKKLLFGVSLENTSITHLIYNKELNRFYLERFNDAGHLEVDPTLFRKKWLSK